MTKWILIEQNKVWPQYHRECVWWSAKKKPIYNIEIAASSYWHKTLKLA